MAFSSRLQPMGKGTGLMFSERPGQRSAAKKKAGGERRSLQALLRLMAEIQLTSWYGKYSHYLQGFNTSQVVVWDFFHQQ